MNRTPPTRRLSIGTLFYKRIFPVTLALGVVVATAWRVVVDGESPLVFWPLWVVGVVGYLVTKLRSMGLADEVLDGGDHLMVRINGDELRVMLHEIDAVKESLYFRQPPQIELRLESSGKFGRIIAFIPTGFFTMPFIRTSLYHELSRRVATARRIAGRQPLE